MKKFLKIIEISIIIIALSIFMWLLGGCASVKKTATEPSIAPADSLRLWEQSLRENITVEDSVLFYNSAEIKIDKSFFQEFNTVEKGVIYSTDSINEILRTVIVKTPGIMVDMIKEKSNPKIIKTQIISFSANDVVYIFSFTRRETVENPKTEVYTGKDGRKYKRNVPVRDPKSFVLVNKASILFRGVLHKNVDVTTLVKNKDDYCSLLVDYRKRKVVNKDVKSAEGWQIK